MEDNCSENNNHVEIGKEGYFSADGTLMPTCKTSRRRTCVISVLAEMKS